MTGDSDGGFRWNLTPGSAPESEPGSAPDGESSSPPATSAGVPTEQTALPYLPHSAGASYPAGALDPAGAPESEAQPTFDAWDVPTAASPVTSRSVFPLPPNVPSTGAPALPPYVPPAFDAALEGVTEVLGAHPVALPDPVDEGLVTSDIDVLFEDSRFVDYAAQESLVAPALPGNAARPGNAVISRSPASVVARYSGTQPTTAQPMPRLHKIFLAVAGALVVALALIALFMVGARIGESASSLTPPTPPSAQPSAGVPSATAVGPIAPGDHAWDELLGGECLTLYESPWKQTYTVVECGKPHQAQMLAKGLLPAPAADATGSGGASSIMYPAAADLQAQTSLACSAATVVNFAAAGAFDDIQIMASYPANADQWDAGNRTYYCFASRSGRGDLTGSIAVPAT